MCSGSYATSSSASSVRVTATPYGTGGMASGNAASCISRSMLSSAAVLFRRSRPQRVQRWISTQRRSPRTVTAIGSMPPGHSALRSPGTLRSRCLDQRQRGQWLRCEVPGASSETSWPQLAHRNERAKDKSGDLSENGGRIARTWFASSRSPVLALARGAVHPTNATHGRQPNLAAWSDRAIGSAFRRIRNHTRNGRPGAGHRLSLVDIPSWDATRQ